MNFLPWRNADADTKHDVVRMLVIHGAIHFVVLGAYVSFHPEILAGYMRLPDPIRTLLIVTNFIRNNFLFGFLPASFALLWLDAVIYTHLKKRTASRLALLWFVGIPLILLTALIYYLYVVNLILSHS